MAEALLKSNQGFQWNDGGLLKVYHDFYRPIGTAPTNPGGPSSVIVPVTTIEILIRGGYVRTAYPVYRP
jgi:hypothetical protein